MSAEFNMGAIRRELASVREDNLQTRAEARGVREEVRVGLQQLADTWAEEAAQRQEERQELTATMKKLAEAQLRHDEEISTLRTKQLEDDHDRTRAKTAVTIFRVLGASAFGIVVSICGYLAGSYIEVRDQTRDNAAALIVAREDAARIDREQRATAAAATDTREDMIQVRTRLTSIDESLERIETSLGSRRR